ncbi:MAG: aspartate-semialdehyde dehydrogenase [Candidatus Eutrophobiaceae bacterium]
MTAKRTFDIAVVGATGAVGEALLAILAERDFPVGKIYALASKRSIGKTVPFKNRELAVQALDDFDFRQVQIGLFSAGASISAKHVPRATAANCVVVDNTSQFRYEEDIPLVVPEVNPHALAAYKKTGIIANPNCSTIQLVAVLKPLHDLARITRINVCTYQAVSGSGKAAIHELESQTKAVLEGKSFTTHAYPVQIAFNALPHIDKFQQNGYTKEEMKMVWETRKIMEDDSIQINPTAVRIPVFFGHSEAVHLETEKKLSVEQARRALAASGIKLIDERTDGGYPTAVTHAAGQNPVYAGRIREDISHPRGLNLWIVSDNIRKGAALNSVQLAELLAKNYL